MLIITALVVAMVCLGFELREIKKEREAIEAEYNEMLQHFEDVLKELK